MLGVRLDVLVLAQQPIIETGGLLFFLLAEVDAADPLVLYPLEGRLGFEESGNFVELVPQELVLAGQVGVHGGLADGGQGFELFVLSRG